jgi:hypothetical protein
MPRRSGGGPLGGDSMRRGGERARGGDKARRGGLKRRGGERPRGGDRARRGGDLHEWTASARLQPQQTEMIRDRDGSGHVHKQPSLSSTHLLRGCIMPGGGAAWACRPREGMGMLLGSSSGRCSGFLKVTRTDGTVSLRQGGDTKLRCQPGGCGSILPPGALQQSRGRRPAHRGGMSGGRRPRGGERRSYSGGGGPRRSPAVSTLALPQLNQGPLASQLRLLARRAAAEETRYARRRRCQG